ncbi:MAG: hypothetical protein QNK11_07375 [Legionella sp.]|nr:hypothetical protein [Legionella sp.]
MRQMLFSFLAIFFPWVIFLLEERIGLAFLSMALQVTIIGWFPMIFLAYSHRENISYFAKKTPQPKSDKTQ